MDTKKCLTIEVPIYPSIDEFIHLVRFFPVPLGYEKNKDEFRWGDSTNVLGTTMEVQTDFWYFRKKKCPSFIGNVEENVL